MVSVICANHGRDIKKLRDSLPRGTELFEVCTHLERSAQRNIGIRHCKGDMVIWMDSDQYFGPGTVKECEFLLKIGYSAVYIPEIIITRSFFGAIRAFERTFYVGTAIDVPKAVLRSKCPYFDETISGPEDALWGSQIKGLRAVSKGVLYHDDDKGFWDYCKKKAYYSKSMRRYTELNPNDKCLNLKYRCWDVFVENGKYKELLKHPILSLGIVFLLIVRGAIYYANR